jgi:hypothetical protein
VVTVLRRVVGDRRAGPVFRQLVDRFEKYPAIDLFEKYPTSPFV